MTKPPLNQDDMDVISARPRGSKADHGDPGLEPTEALEQVEPVKPRPMSSGLAVEANRSHRRLGQLAIEAPSRLSDEARDGTVLRHGTDEMLLVPMPKQIVGAHRTLSRVPSTVAGGR